MPAQPQTFQTSMPTGNRWSLSSAPMPAMIMPQAMADKIMPQIPLAPMAAPLPNRDDLYLMTRQLEGMDLGAPSGRLPQRQPLPKVLPRGHPDPLRRVDRELVHDIDEFDDEEMFRTQFTPRGDRRASAPVLIPQNVPFYQPIHHGSVTAAGAIVHPNAQIMVNENGQTMFNPSGKFIPSLRPYSYDTDQSPMAGMYPNINRDLQTLSTLSEMRSTKSILPLVDILVQRTPTEMEALRRHFRTMNGDTDLSVAIKTLLNASNERDSVKYALMGLVLGPVGYDLWLIQHPNIGKLEDILIDIFIGRVTQDIRFLLFKFQQEHGTAMSGRTISSTVATATSREILQSALDIAIENTRPDGTYPVDQNLVHRDVDQIVKILKTSFPSHTELFNILLRRSNEHIMQVNVYYCVMKGSRGLHEDLRRNSAMPTMMKKIAVQAVRSATDPTYRDVMLLKDVLGSGSIGRNGSSEKLAIRICRMHWYGQHWRQVKSGYIGYTQGDLVDKVRGQRGLLRDLLVAICLV